MYMFRISMLHIMVCKYFCSDAWEGQGILVSKTKNISKICKVLNHAGSSAVRRATHQTGLHEHAEYHSAQILGSDAWEEQGMRVNIEKMWKISYFKSVRSAWARTPQSLLYIYMKRVSITNTGM